MPQGEGEAGHQHQDQEEPKPQPALGHVSHGRGYSDQTVHQGDLTEAVRHLNIFSILTQISFSYSL